MVEERHFVDLWFNINVTLLEITKYPSQIIVIVCPSVRLGLTMVKFSYSLVWHHETAV